VIEASTTQLSNCILLHACSCTAVAPSCANTMQKHDIAYLMS